MVGHGLRALWDEPRAAQPPTRVWRDGVLVGVVVVATVAEAVIREDRSWLPLAVAVSLVVAATLLVRRTRPLLAVTVAFGTLIAFDVARIVAIDVTGLVTIAASLVLPYALLRWGSGREAVGGLTIVLAWLGVTFVADPTGVAEVVAGYGFFLFSAALGASIRFHATSRQRAIEQAELRQRHELARDLHDTIGHHVSGIVVQAQAGRALAASDPERALGVLTTIEDAAKRALQEMRSILGVLREGDEPALSPQPGIADLDALARRDGSPIVSIQRSGALDDLSPSLDSALYRIAQEALTNAFRHARDATRVDIEVAGDTDRVRLVVRDDGTAVGGGRATAGFGLVGMRERAALLGGNVQAGPGPEGGWIVDVALPKRSGAMGRHGGTTTGTA